MPLGSFNCVGDAPFSCSRSHIALPRDALGRIEPCTTGLPDGPRFPGRLRDRGSMTWLDYSAMPDCPQGPLVSSNWNYFAPLRGGETEFDYRGAQRGSAFTRSRLRAAPRPFAQGS